MPASIDFGQIGEVLATMQSGQRPVRDTLEKREMQQVDVKMQYVEFVRAQTHLVQHRKMCCDVGLELRGVKTNRLLAHHDEARLGAGVTAREQRDVLAERNQGIRKVRDHSLGAAVKA